MSFDELSDGQKLQAKQDFLVRLADKDMFVKTMKEWFPDEYKNEMAERGPTYGELDDADRLVSDDVIRQDGASYVADDFDPDPGAGDVSQRAYNNSAMREALCKIVRICDGEDTGGLNERVAIYNIAKAALATPARNCDRFNSGDAIKDGNDACDAWYDEPDAMRQHFSHWILSEVANGRGGDDGSK